MISQVWVNVSNSSTWHQIVAHDITYQYAHSHTQSTHSHTQSLSSYHQTWYIISQTYIISHTPTYSHTHTHPHTISRSLSLSRALFLSLALSLARALSHTNTHIQNVRAKNSPPCCADESRCVNMAALEACTTSSSESNTAYAAACLIAIAFDPPVCDVTHVSAWRNPILQRHDSFVLWPVAFGTPMCVKWIDSKRGMTRFMSDLCLGLLAKSHSRV